MNTDQNIGPTAEQVLYANILNKGMLIGLGLLLVTFAIYISGILPPYVPVEKLSDYWQLNVHDYLEQLGIPCGWGWLHLLGYGDYLDFIGIAVLAGVSIVCYISIIPAFLKAGDTIYVVLVVLEVIVLVAAATGLIAGGHH
ncbi:MAG: hypothetical protein CSA21_06605 [Deltaproteobacteria bacterium]|nr:MAG: hypothetical protein CSA21_06605 [Deltaproteobacteria bacterium]